MKTPKPRYTVTPSPLFSDLVARIHGSIYAAATAWGIEYRSLRRFLEGTHQLHGPTIAQIIERTGLPYEKLFEHAPRAAR
jgi:hypothetical protein